MKRPQMFRNKVNTTATIGLWLLFTFGVPYLSAKSEGEPFSSIEPGLFVGSGIFAVFLILVLAFWNWVFTKWSEFDKKVNDYHEQSTKKGGKQNETNREKTS